MSAAAASPLHLRPAMLGLVLAGGTIGTAARAVLAAAIPTVGGFPLGILLINLAGSFVLGLLLESLLRAGPDVGRRRMARLAAGTGFCGGFTTFSTHAVGTAELLRAGATGLALGYAIGTVVLGAIICWLGVLVGSPR